MPVMPYLSFSALSLPSWEMTFWLYSILMKVLSLIHI